MDTARGPRRGARVTLTKEEACLDASFRPGRARIDETGATVRGGILEQADACFGKLKALVETAGGTMADFVMLNIYVTDPKYLAELTPVRERNFPEPPYPPASGYAVSALLDPAWLVEIDGVAVIPD